MENKKPKEVEFNGWMPGEFRIAADNPNYGMKIRIGIWARVEGDYYAADNIKLKQLEGTDDGVGYIPDAIEINKSQAEELMDSLWRAGIRPSHSKLKKLQVGALEDHLSDMKRMVFEFLMPKVMEDDDLDIRRELDRIKAEIVEAVESEEAYRRRNAQKLDRLTKQVDIKPPDKGNLNLDRDDY